jgi:hypothetical protein
LNNEKEHGVFELRTPEDLLGKLRIDLKRLEADPLDQYAPFDFFVSASHMPDWLSPGIDAVSVDGRTAMRESNILLQICDHIATGFKHFEASAKRHNSVSRTELREGAFSRQFSRQFDISELTVYLQGPAADKYGDSVDALDLAHLGLDYWENELTRLRTGAT